MKDTYEDEFNGVVKPLLLAIEAMREDGLPICEAGTVEDRDAAAKLAERVKPGDVVFTLGVLADKPNAGGWVEKWDSTRAWTGTSQAEWHLDRRIDRPQAVFPASLITGLVSRFIQTTEDVRVALNAFGNEGAEAAAKRVAEEGAYAAGTVAAIAEALGMVHEPSTGDSRPASRKALVGAIQELIRLRDEREAEVPRQRATSGDEPLAWTTYVDRVRKQAEACVSATRAQVRAADALVTRAMDERECAQTMDALGAREFETALAAAERVACERRNAESRFDAACKMINALRDGRDNFRDKWLEVVAENKALKARIEETTEQNDRLYRQGGEAVQALRDVAAVIGVESEQGTIPLRDACVAAVKRMATLALGHERVQAALSASDKPSDAASSEPAADAKPHEAPPKAGDRFLLKHGIVGWVSESGTRVAIAFEGMPGDVEVPRTAIARRVSRENEPYGLIPGDVVELHPCVLKWTSRGLRATWALAPGCSGSEEEIRVSPDVIMRRLS